jgi:hypothetical protein
VSERPTDDELERIQAAGEQQEMDRDQYANNAEIDNAGRRALYEAGIGWVLKDLEDEMRYLDPRDTSRDLEDWIAEVRRGVKS